jgi:hypothetical protein
VKNSLNDDKMNIIGKIRGAFKKSEESKKEEMEKTGEKPEETKKLTEKKVEGKKQELIEKYGVTKEIPEREVEEEREEVKPKEKVEELEEVKLPEIILRVEKIDGRLDALDDFRKDMNERIIQLAEEIGELRSTILERDKAFTRVEADAEKTLELVQDVEPGKIKRDIEKFEKENLENIAKIEKIENLVAELSKESKKFRDLMERIKSFENLVNISTEIQSKMSKIEEAKRYTDAIASKVESIFSETNVKLADFENQKDRINKLDELTTELVKTLDEVSIKLTRFVEKEKFERLEDDLKKVKQVKGIEPLPELSELKSTIGEILNTLSELKFVELLNIIPYMKDQSMMTSCLTELDGIVNEMKQKNIWDEDKERLLKDFLVSE